MERCRPFEPGRVAWSCTCTRTCKEEQCQCLTVQQQVDHSLILTSAEAFQLRGCCLSGPRPGPPPDQPPTPTWRRLTSRACRRKFPWMSKCSSGESQLIKGWQNKESADRDLHPVEIPNTKFATVKWRHKLLFDRKAPNFLLFCSACIEGRVTSQRRIKTRACHVLHDKLAT